jgi:fucose 4-O-acetylase-like acetyltransferase
MKRIIWLDYAKVIGLFFVILGHIVKNGQDSLRIFVYSFHMPLFFLLSGYLHKERHMKQSIVTGFKKILVPYLYFFAVIILAWLAFAVFVRHYDWNTIVDKLVIFNIEKIFLGKGNMLKGGWFLLSLFTIKFVFDVILKLRTLKLQIMAIFSCVCLLLLIKLLHIPNMFNIGSSCMALPFYSFGFYLNKYHLLEKTEFYLDWKKYIWIGLFFFILTVVGVYFNGRVSVSGIILGQKYLFYFIALLGIIFIYCISKLFEYNRMQYNTIQLLSTGSIVVFITHFYIIDLLLSIFGNDVFINCIVRIAVALVILFTEIPIVIIFQKYLSFMLGERTLKNGNYSRT